MLQRIQTIYLLATMVSGLSLLIDPMNLAHVDGDIHLLKSQSQSMLNDGIFQASEHMALLILIGLIAVLSVVSIFQFKNRNRQVVLVRLTIFAFILLVILAGLFFYQDYSMLEPGSNRFKLGYGIIAPLAGLIFAILAVRAIRKDEKLIRSMDRLR